MSKSIEVLKFELHELEKDLQSIDVSTFVLNPRIPKLVKDIKELRKEIKEAESNE
jgi:hypothetical protein